MSLLESTAERVRMHEEELREVYELYSSGSSSASSGGLDTELWFLSCTLAGVPSKVCAVVVVENYRNGEPIRFRSRSIKVGYHREFRRLCNVLYAGEHRGVDATPYIEELEETFDLRETGQLGVAVVDLFDQEIVSIFDLERISDMAEQSSEGLMKTRGLVFEVRSSDSVFWDIDTGRWDESRIIGPNEAINRGWFSALRRFASDPTENSVYFVSKDKLRGRNNWSS